MSTDQIIRRALRAAQDSEAYVQVNYTRGNGLPERGKVTALARETFLIDGNLRRVAHVRSITFTR